MGDRKPAQTTRNPAFYIFKSLMHSTSHLSRKDKNEESHHLCSMTC